MKIAEIANEARVPYEKVRRWVTQGHSRLGRLPSINVAEQGQRASFRVDRKDWENFKMRLQTPVEIDNTDVAILKYPKPRQSNGMFNY